MTRVEEKVIVYENRIQKMLKRVDTAVRNVSILKDQEQHLKKKNQLIMDIMTDEQKMELERRMAEQGIRESSRTNKTDFIDKVDHQTIEGPDP